MELVKEMCPINTYVISPARMSRPPSPPLVGYYDYVHVLNLIG